MAVALTGLAAVSDAPPTQPWLVIVSLDTVRADALGATGGAGAITPHLDALAARSAVFTRHFSSAPTTLASHTALLTGTWPHRHGVPRNGFVVDGANETLAELLAAQGWQTAGFVGAEPLAHKYGLNQGFQTWGDAVGDAYARPGARVVDEALAWVAAAPDRPTLLFVHLYDAHAPYGGPPGYVAAHGGTPTTTAEHPGSSKHIDRARALCERHAPGWQEEGAALRVMYASGVSWLDHQVGRLLSGLEREGVLDRAVLVVTADHGEAFDDHDECWNHGYGVLDETTHVPLLVSGPGLPIGEVDRLGSNLDVLPTVLDLVGVPVPTGVQGVSFAPTLRGEAQPPRGPVFSEATKPYDDPGDGWTNARRRKAARSDQLRLVWEPRRDRRWLYEPERDPAESQDRWAFLGDEPGVRALDLSLSAWAASADPLPTTRVEDDETKAALEALGYVEGAP